jgi:hypothetical protein
MAVIEYQKSSGREDAFPMHDEIRAHFDVIWNNATIPIRSYWMQHSAWIDEPAGQSGLVNVFNVTNDGRERISAVFRAFKDGEGPFRRTQTTSGISIQGISLKSFFSSGPLSDRMYEIIRGGQTDIRILFLDRDSEQARFRSYREHLLRPQGAWVDYDAFTEAHHRESTLYRDTKDAIEQLKRWIGEFARDENWTCRVQAREYRSAPMCFVLQVGDRLFTEPYNYGKLGGSRAAPATLGTDMPLFEFEREVPAMFDGIEYQKGNLALRNPFLLVMDHFDFAFRTATAMVLPSTAAPG